MKCFECEDAVKKLFDDPRSPPLEEGPCLCLNCVYVAHHDQLEQAVCELNNYIFVAKKFLAEDEIRSLLSGLETIDGYRG